MKIKKIVSVVLVLIVAQLFLACENNASKSQNVADPGKNEDTKVVGIPVIYETDLTLDVDDVGAPSMVEEGRPRGGKCSYNGRSGVGGEGGRGDRDKTILPPLSMTTLRPKYTTIASIGQPGLQLSRTGSVKEGAAQLIDEASKLTV